MEPLSASASVPGILAFAGQAINGLSTLIAVFNNIKSGNKKIPTMFGDLASLKDLLQSVSILMQCWQSEAGEQLNILSILENIVKGCNNFIAELTERVEELGLERHTSRLAKLVLKTKIALDLIPFKEIRDKMSFHYQKIHVNMELSKQYVFLRALRQHIELTL